MTLVQHCPRWPAPFCWRWRAPSAQRRRRWSSARAAPSPAGRRSHGSSFSAGSPRYRSRRCRGQQLLARLSSSARQQELVGVRARAEDCLGPLGGHTLPAIQPLQKKSAVADPAGTGVRESSCRALYAWTVSVRETRGEYPAHSTLDCPSDSTKSPRQVPIEFFTAA